MALDGVIQIGPDGFNIRGTFHFSLISISTTDITGNPYYYFDMTAGATVSATVFGLSFGGIGVSASFHAEARAARLDALGDGDH